MVREAKIIYTAEDRTKAAAESVKRGMGQVGEMARLAGFSLAALGGAGTIAGMVAMLKRINDSVDALNDLSDATGSSIENISALEDVASRNGHAFESVSTTLVRFNQVLSDTRKPGSDAEKVLKALGLNAQRLRELDPAEALHETAVAFGRFADDGNKARAMQELFGKSTKEVAAFVKDLAEQQKLNATLTTKQTDEAEKFNKQLFAMQTELRDVGREIAKSVVPEMANMLKHMREIRELGGLWAFIGSGAESASMDNPFGKITELEGKLAKLLSDRQKIAGSAANNGPLRYLPLFGTVGDLHTLDEQIKQVEKQLDFFRRLDARRLKEAGSGATQAEMDWFAPPRSIGGLDDEAKKRDAAAKATKGLSEAEKELAAHVKYRREQFLAAHDAEAKARAEAEKAAAEYALSLDAQVMKSVEALDAAMQEEAAYGLLKSQVVDLTIAKLEASKISALTPEELAATEAQIENYRRLKEVFQRGELRDANKKAADDAARQWDQTWGQVAESFTDNLMRGGKSVAQYLKDLFRTLVLRPILAPVGQMLANSIGGIFGAPGAGIGSALGGMGGMFPGWGAGIAGAGSFGIGGAFGQAMGATLQNGLIGGFSANMANIGTLASGGQFMGALGAAAPYIGAAVAIASLLSGKFKGETRVGGQYHDTQFVAGPSGGQISGATDAIAATMAAIEANLAGLGASTRVTRLVSGLEQSEKGKGFAFGGAWLSNGMAVGQGTDGMGWMNRRGSMTSEQALAAFGEELMQVRLEVIQASDAVGPLADYVRSLGDISALSSQQLQAAIGRVDKALTERAALEDRLFALTASEAEQLARARERERAAIDSTNHAILDQIYAVEDQRRANELATIAAEEAARAQEEAAQAQRQYAEEMQSQLLDAYGDLQDVMQGVIDKNNAYAASLRAVRLNLTTGPGALLSPEARYMQTGAEFRRLSALPVGDEERLEKLAEAGAAFAAASQQYNASSMQYFADRDEIVRAVEASEIHAKANVDVAQLQLNAARSQLTELGLIKTGVTTLAQAQAAFNAAMQAYLAAQRTGGGLPTNPVPGQPGYVSVPSAGGIIIPSDRIIDHDQGSYIGPMTPQLPAFTPSQSAAFWGFSLNGSHASGLDYVPFDGYRAELHRGERVQTAAQARAADQTAALMQQLVNENRDLNQRMEALTKVVASYAQRDLEIGASLAESMRGAKHLAMQEMARARPKRMRE